MKFGKEYIAEVVEKTRIYVSQNHFASAYNIALSLGISTNELYYILNKGGTCLTQIANSYIIPLDNDHEKVIFQKELSESCNQLKKCWHGPNCATHQEFGCKIYLNTIGGLSAKKAKRHNQLLSASSGDTSSTGDASEQVQS